jgi:hypothetical protein
MLKIDIRDVPQIKARQNPSNEYTCIYYAVVKSNSRIQVPIIVKLQAADRYSKNARIADTGKISTEKSQK